MNNSSKLHINFSRIYESFVAIIVNNDDAE